MSVLKHKRTPKWNRRPKPDAHIARTTLNTWVKDAVNTRFEFRPIEYVLHRKIDYDVLVC